MSKKQLQIAIVCLFIFFCIIKSAVPVRLDIDKKGYDCLWYVCVFAAAAYCRRFGFPALEKKGRGLLLYLVSVALVLAETFALRALYLKTGSLERMLGVAFEYNHIFAFTAAAGLFFAFKNVKLGERLGRIICAIAPLTLGVYLLHENLGLRYSWQAYFGAGKVSGAGLLLATSLLAVIVMFTVGIAVEKGRQYLFAGINRLLSKLGIYRKLTAAIAAADSAFSKKNEEVQKED